jgi:Cof subfamily protein (haloacid dehalogenase superfamily)
VTTTGEKDAKTTIICVDFDGTLVDDDGFIHPTDVEILANERSAAFVPATGRPLHAVRRTFERYGLFTGHPIPFPLILENGAAVYSENEMLRSQRSFDPELQDELMRVVRASERASFILFSLNEARLVRANETLWAMVRRFDLDPQPFELDQKLSLSLSKVAVTAEDPESLHAFQAEIAELPLEQTYSLPDVLELTPVGVHKGGGLSILLEDAGRHDTEVVVAGDGENDLALFDLATLSFAPESSPPAIQARADHVLDLREEGLLAPILREIGVRR